MMPNPIHVAVGGVALAVTAAVILFLGVFFGDLFLKSEWELRRWREMFTWCVVGGLLATAVAVTWAVIRLHH